MKKIVLAIVFILMLAAPVMASAEVNVLVDGVVLDNPGLLIDGRAYVPIRSVCTGLGAQATWNGNQVIVSTEKRPTVTGESDFRSQIIDALVMLETKDRIDYELICRYVVDIRKASINIPSKDGTTSAMSTADSIVFSPGMWETKNDLTTQYIAAVLVHEATHLYNHQKNIYGPQDENIAYMHEITALVVLGGLQTDITGTEQNRLRIISK